MNEEYDDNTDITKQIQGSFVESQDDVPAVLPKENSDVHLFDANGNEQELTTGFWCSRGGLNSVRSRGRGQPNRLSGPPPTRFRGRGFAPSPQMRGRGFYRGRGVPRFNNGGNFDRNWGPMGPPPPGMVGGPIPFGPPNILPPNMPAPELWIEAKTANGSSYYYHSRTRDTTWTRPQESAACVVMTHEEMKLKVASGQLPAMVVETQAPMTVTSSTVVSKSMLQTNPTQSTVSTMSIEESLPVVQSQDRAARQALSVSSYSTTTDSIPLSLPSFSQPPPWAKTELTTDEHLSKIFRKDTMPQYTTPPPWGTQRNGLGNTVSQTSPNDVDTILICRTDGVHWSPWPALAAPPPNFHAAQPVSAAQITSLSLTAQTTLPLQMHMNQIPTQINSVCQISSVPCQINSVPCQINSVQCQLSSFPPQMNSLQPQISSLQPQISSIPPLINSVQCQRNSLPPAVYSQCQITSVPPPMPNVRMNSVSQISSIPVQNNNIHMPVPDMWLAPESRNGAKYLCAPKKPTIIEVPTTPTVLSDDVEEAASSWTAHSAPDGRPYYYNAKLNKSVWVKPKSIKKLEELQEKIDLEKKERIERLKTMKFDNCDVEVIDLDQVEDEDVEESKEESKQEYVKTKEDVDMNEIQNRSDETSKSNDTKNNIVEISNSNDDLKMDSNDTVKNSVKSESVCSNVECYKSEEVKVDVKKDEKSSKKEETEESEKKKKDSSLPLWSKYISGTTWQVVWTAQGEVFFFNPTAKPSSVYARPAALMNREDVDRIINNPPEAVVKAQRRYALEKTAKLLSNGSPQLKRAADLDSDRSDDEEVIKKNRIEEGYKSTISPTESLQDIEAPLKQRMNLFKQMLIDRKVSAISTWEKELHKIGFDKRYHLLSIDQKKLVFNEFVKERSEEEKKEMIKQMRQIKNAFIELIQEAKVNYKTTFDDFSNKHGLDERYICVEKHECRKAYFSEYIAELSKKEKEEKEKRKEQASAG